MASPGSTNLCDHQIRLHVSLFIFIKILKSTFNSFSIVNFGRNIWLCVFILDRCDNKALVTWFKVLNRAISNISAILAEKGVRVLFY